MQDFLTIAATTVLFAAPVYFATMFVLGLTTRRTAPKSIAVAPEPSAILETIAPAAPQPIADIVVPFARPQPKSPTVAELPNWSALSPYDLRKACQAQGIKWRNADPKTGKHLKKAAMIEALSALVIAA